MLHIYSFLLLIAFFLLSPLFLVRREKYAAGFMQRLGYLPERPDKNSKALWIHCVSVGEVNAARKLVDLLRTELKNHPIVISTTTKTGQDLALDVFKGKAEIVFYFPYDWKFIVRRALRKINPSLVLLMETELWPNFIAESDRAGVPTVLLNGRLSQKSFDRYRRINLFLSPVLRKIRLALMQAPRDAERIEQLGIPSERVSVPGNLKFDQDPLESNALTDSFRERFAFDGVVPLIVAASTHDPEEKILLEAFRELRKTIAVRLMIAPRHPQRFDAVARIAAISGLSTVRRSQEPNPADAMADVVILDSIGELRSVYPLATLVFCGGSLIPHGGQSMLEPASEGKPIVTGFHTYNFANAVEVFAFHDAIVTLPELGIADAPSQLSSTFYNLISNPELMMKIGTNAKEVMDRNRGASEKTLDALRRLLGESE